jgi:DNA-binding NarL/FixJ family response regulator
MEVKPMKVLLLDDSEIVREVVRDALERSGYVVVTLDHALGFNHALREVQPDLALVDVAMPALHGDKLVEIARDRQTHSCPIVLFSDRSERELSQLARRCGAAGYIQKSDDTDRLIRSIERFVHK